MSLTTLPAEQALNQLARFDAVLDARSENEYALDHMPEALNWPTLHDDERRDIGTLYKQVNAFEAKKRGAAIAARNIAEHIERHALDLPKGWQPLIYCWRGGKRSGSLSLILSEIGFRVTLVEGGYKALRHALLADIPVQVQRLQLRVICGTTGSGKTRLLQALAAEGAQVLDLEALACHRSSVLGAVPGQDQPSQKAFDTRVWDALRRLDARRVVYVESESRKVGNLAVPEALIDAMRAAPCLSLELPDAERVALLLEDYAHFAQDADAFCQRLDALVELRGREVIDGWKAEVRAGRIEGVVQELLVRHYDPVYRQSMNRNFSHYAQASVLRPRDHGEPAMQALARQMLAAGDLVEPVTAT